MVPFTSIVAMVITLFICFTFPLMLFISLRRSSRNVTGAAIAGAIAFYISQMVIRIPIIQVILPRFDWFNNYMQSPFFYIIFLSISAALFEETARLLTFTLLLKEKQAWKPGISYGIGHGGIEAILIVGLTYINNIVLSIMINKNTFSPFLKDKVDDKMAQNIYSSLIDTPSDLFLTAGVERALVITIQIALSVFILEGIIKHRKLLYYTLAIFFHTSLNSISSYLAYIKLNYWLIELIIALFAVAAAIYIYKSKKRFGNFIDADDEAVKALEEGY